MESWDFLFANNDEYVIDFAVCQLKTIIGALHAENADSLGYLSVTLSPSTSRCAKATSTIKRGALKLAPVATQIISTDSDNPKHNHVPDWALATRTTLAFSGGRTGKLYIIPRNPVQAGEGKKQSEFIARFGVVTTTQDNNAANMQIESEEIVAATMQVESEFHVPVMFNTRVIEKGEELLLYQRRGCLSRWPIADAGREPPAKQAKQ